MAAAAAGAVPVLVWMARAATGGAVGQDGAVQPSMIIRVPAMLEVTTRGHFTRGLWDSGKLIAPHTKYDYGTTGTIPGLATGGSSCPSDLAIVVHGWDNDWAGGQEKFKRARAALKGNGYMGLVIGYSWDSDTRTGVADLAGFDDGMEAADFVALDLHAADCRSDRNRCKGRCGAKPGNQVRSRNPGQGRGRIERAARHDDGGRCLPQLEHRDCVHELAALFAEAFRRLRHRGDQRQDRTRSRHARCPHQQCRRRTLAATGQDHG